MHLPHNAAVLVADGRKLLFLRNAGDDANPELVVVHDQEQPNAADRDQKSDAPGRSAANVGGGQSVMDEPDYHQQREDRFAAAAADLLKQRALAHAFEALIVVAAPRTLGELRKHYHSEVNERLTGELAKDLTGHALPDIAAAIKAA